MKCFAFTIASYLLLFQGCATSYAPESEIKNLISPGPPQELEFDIRLRLDAISRIWAPVNNSQEFYDFIRQILKAGEHIEVGRAAVYLSHDAKMAERLAPDIMDSWVKWDCYFLLQGYGPTHFDAAVDLKKILDGLGVALSVRHLSREECASDYGDSQLNAPISTTSPAGVRP